LNPSLGRNLRIGTVLTHNFSHFFQILSCSFSTSKTNFKAYKGKIYSTTTDAVEDIPNGSKLLVGGFGKFHQNL
jgi:hypothetical protein